MDFAFLKRPEILKHNLRSHRESRLLERRKLDGRPIEELDKLAAQLSGPRRGYFNLTSAADMQLARQLSALSIAYWMHHQLNSDLDSGNLPGQELQQRAYDLLCKRLGMWHPDTVWALRLLTDWDITTDRRQKYLEETAAQIESHEPDPLAFQMVLGLVKCCLRNGDHGSNSEALRTLLQGIAGDPDKVQCSKEMFNEWKIALHYVQIEQKDWDAADQLDLDIQGLKGEHGTGCPPELWLPENCSTLEDLQILLGMLEKDEGALIKGAVFETSWDLNFRPCTELLLNMYMEQGGPGLKKAEEWLRPLIRSNGGAGGLGRLPFRHQGRKLASRLIRVRNWEPSFIPDERVCALHILCTFRCKYQLADVYARQQRYVEARPLLEEVVNTKLHRRNPDFLASKDLLVTVYLKLEEPDKAQGLQEKIVDDITKTFGEGSQQLLPALRLLSKIYRMNGQWPKKNEVDLCILRYRE